MKRRGLIIIVGLLLSSILAFGQEIYRWVDEKGIVHFSDDLSLVPEIYRDQIPKTKSTQEPSSPPSVESPKRMGEEKDIESAPQSAPPEQKDILGRGEEWWRAKAEEWNEKLKAARENYEKAYSEWKSKQQELETSQFKPDSLKRKLNAETRALEEKAKDWEKQMEEAKNMLENVLPKQAREYRADPDWLKTEEHK